RVSKDHILPLLNSLGILNGLFKYKLSPELCKWLDEFQPDVIYAQAQTRANVLFCTAVQEYLNKPMVFHMMDDWPELVKEEGLLRIYWSQKIDKEFKNILDKSSLHLSISEPMAVEYKRRYGHEFNVFHNHIDLDFWKKFQRKDYVLADEPTILYAGRVGMGINESLEIMAQAVGLLNQELNISLKFVLQVSEKPDWTRKYPWVEFREFVAYNDLPQKFAQADFLYLPYDFSPSSIKFIKYSMPTKAPEFMVSGTPIIIFAPKETA